MAVLYYEWFSNFRYWFNQLFLRDVVVIGGGLAGLISAHQLASAGLDVLLVEKKSYPFHRVCGEYISNEVLPFLNANNLFPEELAPVQISRFSLTSVNGKEGRLKLDLGGFGLSRYNFDNYLYASAKHKGAEFQLNTSVKSASFQHDRFEVVLSNGTELEARIVIGAHGKRDRLDREMNRDFFQKRTPYLGVKYHIKYDMPEDLIALHNFQGGYCGISHVEGSRLNLCYLSERANLRSFGSIPEMERGVLYRNPFLKDIFTQGEFLFDSPKVINEISFATKKPVEGHMLMAGDSAGMITPLCGNGMAMAIHSGKVLSELVVDYFADHRERLKLEATYSREWHKLFAKRLWIGRRIQSLFGGVFHSNVAVNLARSVKPVAKFLVSKTHGKPF